MVADFGLQRVAHNLLAHHIEDVDAVQRAHLASVLEHHLCARAVCHPKAHRVQYALRECERTVEVVVHRRAVPAVGAEHLGLPFGGVGAERAVTHHPVLVAVAFHLGGILGVQRDFALFREFSVLCAESVPKSVHHQLVEAQVKHLACLGVNNVKVLDEGGVFVAVLFGDKARRLGDGGEFAAQYVAASRLEVRVLFLLVKIYQSLVEVLQEVEPPTLEVFALAHLLGVLCHGVTFGECPCRVGVECYVSRCHIIGGDVGYLLCRHLLFCDGNDVFFEVFCALVGVHRTAAEVEEFALGGQQLLVIVGYRVEVIEPLRVHQRKPPILAGGRQQRTAAEALGDAL